VTEKNIVGYYRSKDSSFNYIKLNPDQTFLYEHFDAAKFDAVKFELRNVKIDSCHFITKGNWKLIKNKLILNSYDLYRDTTRIRKILESPNDSKKSHFLFKDVNEKVIYFSSVRNLKYYSSKENYLTIYDAYFSNVDIEANAGDILIFNLVNYKPFHYVIKDNVSSNYTMTLAPYYKQGYFKDKKLVVKTNRLIDGDQKLKKIKLANK
jgi:hypothetical protein